MFNAEPHVTLIINARRIWELMRLEVDFRLCFIFVIDELSHDLPIYGTSEAKQYTHIYI